MHFNLKQRITLSSAFHNEDNHVLVRHEKEYIEENDKERIEAVHEWGEKS